MPFDSPLPAIDMQLLQVWLREPPVDANGMFEAGAAARGAQCDPALYDGLACDQDDLVRCNDDFNFGDLPRRCAKGCQITEPCIQYEPDPPDPAKPTCLKTGPAIAECIGD
jgi:hypothetical protein